MELAARGQRGKSNPAVGTIVNNVEIFHERVSQHHVDTRHRAQTKAPLAAAGRVQEIRGGRNIQRDGGSGVGSLEHKGDGRVVGGSGGEAHACEDARAAANVGQRAVF